MIIWDNKIQAQTIIKPYFIPPELTIFFIAQKLIFEI